MGRGNIAPPLKEVAVALDVNVNVTMNETKLDKLVHMVFKLTEKVDVMTEQFDALAARLDVATNDIATKLNDLKAKLAGGLSGDEAAAEIAKLEPIITRLEGMGKDVADPVPAPVEPAPQ